MFTLKFMDYITEDKLIARRFGHANIGNLRHETVVEIFLNGVPTNE